MLYFKELLVLHSVWKLVNTWDNMYKDYKEIKFWDVQVFDVSKTVDMFFNKFISLVNGFTNMKLEVIETTRNNINEFRRLLPVIDDLKNAAMKDRHWDEIRGVINK